MAKYTLDEIESDEVYHALLERKTTLEKRVKDLSEKDGLPEAAEAVRERLALYNPNGGEGKAARVGLIRQFAPQRDIEAEAAANREERNPAGQQDAFGGGAETGGGHPAGETVKAPAAKRGRKKKGGAAAEGGDAGDVVEEAEYTIVPEERRLASGPGLTDEQHDAVGRLSGIVDVLEHGPATIDASEFEAEAARVVELLRATGLVANGYILSLTNRLGGEYRDAEENAHNLARVVREVLRDIQPAAAAEPADDKPIGGDDAHAGNGLSFAPPATDPAPGDAELNDAGAAGNEPAEGHTAEGARAEAATDAGA